MTAAIPSTIPSAASLASQGQSLYGTANATAIQYQQQAAALVANAQGQLATYQAQATTAWAGVTKGDASGVVTLGAAVARGLPPGAAKQAALDVVSVAEGAVAGYALATTAAGVATVLIGAAGEASLLAACGIAAATVPVIGAIVGAVVAGVTILVSSTLASSPTTPLYPSIAAQLMLTVPYPPVGQGQFDPMKDVSGYAGYSTTAADALALLRMVDVEAANGIADPTAHAGQGFYSPASLAKAAAAALAEVLGGQSFVGTALARAERWAPVGLGFDTLAWAPHLAFPGNDSPPASPGYGADQDAATGTGWQEWGDSGEAWLKRLIPIAYQTAAMGDAEADQVALSYLMACAWAYDNAPDAASTLPAGLAYAIGWMQSIATKVQVGLQIAALAASPSKLLKTIAVQAAAPVSWLGVLEHVAVAFLGAAAVKWYQSHQSREGRQT